MIAHRHADAKVCLMDAGRGWDSSRPHQGFAVQHAPCGLGAVPTRPGNEKPFRRQRSLRFRQRPSGAKGGYGKPLTIRTDGNTQKGGSSLEEYMSFVMLAEIRRLPVWHCYTPAIPFRRDGGTRLNVSWTEDVPMIPVLHAIRSHTAATGT